MKNHNFLAERFLAKKSAHPEKPAMMQPPSPFRALFDCKSMEEGDAQFLATLVPEGGEDFRDLCQVTVELRSIRKQLVFLVGERLFRAREIFARHGDSKVSFSKWITNLGMSRKSAYNALAFYGLYSKLPTEELKELLRKMPAKVSYMLASRDAQIDSKASFIQEVVALDSLQMMRMLSERFPLSQEDKRVKSGKKRVFALLDELEETLFFGKEALSEKEQQEVVAKITFWQSRLFS